MATNPITSDSLTVDFKQLMSIPVGNRVQAASLSPAFLQSLVNSLTPIQIAKAFPDYYRRSLPDISNFILANRYFDAGGQAHQTGGGEMGYAPDYYDGETKPTGRLRGTELTVEQMKEELLKSGIDVEGTRNLIAQGPILEGDNRIQYLKKMSDADLLEAGLQRVQDENGKTLIQMAPSQYEGMPEEKIIEQYNKEFPKASISPRERATLDLIAKREGAKDPNTVFGGKRYVERLGLDKKPLTERTVSEVINEVMPKLRELSKADGYGVNREGRVVGTSAVGTGQMIEGTLKDNLRALGIPEKDWDTIKFDKDLQERLTLMNFKTSGIGDPNADPSTWDHRKLGLQYESFDTSRGHAPMSGEEAMQVREKSAVRPENKEDVTAQEALAKLQESENLRRQEAFIRKSFDAGMVSPTSSDSPVFKNGETVVAERQQDIAGVRRQPITPELKEVLQYAGEESGVTVEVFSGGQADITQGGPRTGSERHDLGHAADIRLKVKDADGNYRTLSSSNPQDREIMANFIKNARKMGAKGIGHGLDYMGESGIHIGTVVRSDLDYSDKEYGAPAGKEAVWRSPEWVQRAFYDGQKAAEEFDMVEYRKKRDERIEKETKLAQENASQNKSGTLVEAEKKAEEVVKITNESSAQLLPESHPFAMTAAKKKRILEAQNVKTEETAVASAAKNSTPQFALGGNMYGLNEDMTLVETETGKPIAQIGQNEKIEKQGNAIQVTPETKLKADELAQKYDASEEVETRMNDIEDRMEQQQETASQETRRPLAPEKVETKAPDMWRESVASAERTVSPSFSRAIARSKFFPEGHHYQRGTVSAKSV